MAQPGNPDLGFNGTGQQISPDRYVTELAHSSALQPDGKLLVAGGGNLMPMTFSDGFIIRRYHVNGQLDISFGQSGKVFSDFGEIQEDIYCMAVQEDGKILVGGVIGNNTANARKGILARYNPNGSLDAGFGVNGRIITSYTNAPGNEVIWRMKLLPGGKILISGYKGTYDGLLAKYTSNGQPDSSFGSNGLVQLNSFQAGGGRSSEDFYVQPNGKILVAGYNKIGGVYYFELSRYLSNGQLDISFNNTGYKTTFIDNMGALGYRITQQPDGKIIVLGKVRRPHGFLPGYEASDFVLVRYQSNGTPDSSFGINGVATANFYEHDVPTGITMQPDGKILVSGSTYHISDQGGRFVLARFLHNGSLDSSFAGNGTRIYDYNIMEGTCYGIHLASQRIYLTGWANAVNNSGTAFNVYAIQNDASPVSVVNVNLCPPVASTTFSAGSVAQSYQWQQSIDSVLFSNIINSSTYGGATTSSLSLINIPSSSFGYQYRCVLSSGVSNTFMLRFSNSWTGTQSSSWENPVNWSCGAVPDANTAVTINSGIVFINSNITVRTLTLNQGATLNVNPAFILTVTH
jgi:uncharacterized delta-60 repeat protein